MGMHGVVSARECAAVYMLIQCQIFRMSMQDLELSDGEKMVSPGSRTPMVFRTSHLLFGMVKSSCPCQHSPEMAPFNMLIVIF
jgi:hypothetical protein